MAKSSKQRMCPAVGREISPAECGENRGSKYACPADCPHNPFAPAQYATLLKLEEGVDKSALSRLLEEAQDRRAVERAMNEALDKGSVHSLHAFVAWKFFFKRDKSGLTCAERWARAGFPTLKNDERVLLRAKMQTRVVLLEVRRVFDKERMSLRAVSELVMMLMLKALINELDRSLRGG